MKPAIAIRIEAIISKIIACFNLSELSAKDMDSISLTESVSVLNKVLRNLYKKLNRTKPDAQAKMHDENSKMPWGIIKSNVWNMSSDVAT